MFDVDKLQKCVDVLKIVHPSNKKRNVEKISKDLGPKIVILQKMDSNISNDANKKVNFEDFSKEDLIKKCKNLLAIAQKAKQTKDVLQEENSRLKQELANKTVVSNNASQELIEKLTQQKLTLVTTIEELKTNNSSLDSRLQMFEKELMSCQEKLNTVDNENISYKRQVNRLADENEQLLTHLDSLEKQIDELNKIGIEQRKQLLELESKSQESKNLVDDNKIVELQCMLSVSLEEVKKLKTENVSLSEKVENLQINLSEKDKSILVISEELKFKCDILDKTIAELNDLKKIQEAESNRVKDYEELKRECAELKQVIDLHKNENFEADISNLEDNNNRLKEKLKLYHSKIIKFAGNAKALKEEKNTILQLFKLYTNQVVEWKNQLDEAGKKLVGLVDTIQSENHKLKDEIKILQQKTSDNILEESNIKLKKIIKDYEDQLKFTKEEHEKEVTSLNRTLDDADNQITNLSQFKSQLESLNLEKQNVERELSSIKETVDQLVEELEQIKKENNNLKDELEIAKSKTESLALSQKDLKNELNLLESEKKSLNIIIKEKDENYKTQTEETNKKLANFEKLTSNLKTQIKKFEDDKEHIASMEKQLAERSSEEIKKLVLEIKELNESNETLREKLEQAKRARTNVFHSDTQTDDDLLPANEFEEQIANLKRKNSELLSEMNEMNQAIKERGETISKLEAHREEVMKKLQIYETQANKNIDNITEKEVIIKNLTEEVESLKLKKLGTFEDQNVSRDEEVSQLKNEIEVLRERLNANLDASYAESDTMSTSTVSRTEEVNRLKDLEGSWEERYGKLRNLAIKLKGKIRELTATLGKEQKEKEEVQKKLSVNLKTIQTLQEQSDRLEDELDKARQECKQYLNRLNTVGEEVSKDKQLLVSKEDTLSELRKEINDLKNEKQSTETWKKQVSAKVQTLRKELEANNNAKKEFEGKVAKLTAEIEFKEQALKAEVENHKQTKNLLDLSNNECKKNSVLNLEMQDYERSIKETSKKLEKQQEQITKLKGQVESQKSTINALREQTKILEERVQEEESNLGAATSEISAYKKKVVQLEEEIQQKDEKVQSVTQLLETSRSENEELSSELSKVIAEHQKANGILKNERDHLRSQTLGLQQNLREVQDVLKLKEDELKIIQNDYEGYKVRAQSVLRQNQNRDVGLEEKLNEELATLRTENSRLISQLDKNNEEIKVLLETNEKLSALKEDYLKKIEEMECEIEELKHQYAQLLSKHQKTLSERDETIRSLKVHADTLSQCYRQQIADLEMRHNKEVIELQNRLEKAPSPVETPPVLPTMTREEGEGSESIESNNAPVVHPIPLERLLDSDSNQEYAHLKKQLNEQESKIVHLTALLSDTEQDLAKHVQMNTLLKEEIRRQQRSVEREKHAENLEYLKNVVFKFVTLNSGDERTRLVPVLNTILKLSPDETQKLNLVAKGESGLKGWTNYLPTWSSNKPQ